MNQPLATTSTTSVAVAPGIEQYLTEFSRHQIPVLSTTRTSIQTLREQDRDTLPLLCRAIIQDPGFTLSIIQRTNQRLKERGQALAETLQHAALLLGIPFIHQLNDEALVLEEIEDEKLRTGLAQHYQDKHFLARYVALCLPRTLRGQSDEFMLASMLYGAVHTHLWLSDMTLAQQLEQSGSVRDDIKALQSAYAHSTGLPELNQPDIQNDPRQALLSICASVTHLASRDWHSESIMPELERLSGLTDTPVDDLLLKLKHAAISSARDLQVQDACAAARKLPQYQESRVMAVPKPSSSRPGPAENNHKTIYKECLETLKAAARGEPLSAHEIISTGMKAMHEGLKLPRVSFVMMNRERTAMQSKYLQNSGDHAPLTGIKLAMTGKHLFIKLMSAPSCLWVNSRNRQKYWSHLPAEFREHIATDSFLAMSIFIDDKPIGMFYADSHGMDLELTDRHQQHFKQICQMVSKALAGNKTANK